MSDDSGSSDDGEDYAYGESYVPESKRYPVHDCCEFEDVEALRVSKHAMFASALRGVAIFLAVFILGVSAAPRRASFFHRPSFSHMMFLQF